MTLDEKPPISPASRAGSMMLVMGVLYLILFIFTATVAGYAFRSSAGILLLVILLGVPVSYLWLGGRMDGQTLWPAIIALVLSGGHFLLSLLLFLQTVIVAFDIVETWMFLAIAILLGHLIYLGILIWMLGLTLQLISRKQRESIPGFQPIMPVAPAIPTDAASASTPDPNASKS